MNVDTKIAARVRDLRKARDLSLDALAELSGVSRSMISLVERGETSPTAGVLNKLADALGVTLASLFTDEAVMGASPLSHHAEQVMWQDPASGYIRRHVSPTGFHSPLELVEVIFPAGETVTFENIVRNVVTHQQVWILEGEMVITIDDEVFHLRQGDCLAMTLGHRSTFHNPKKKSARYTVALTTTPNQLKRSA